MCVKTAVAPMTALAGSLKGCFVPACGLPDMRQAFGGLNPG